MTETTTRAVEHHRSAGALAVQADQESWTDQQHAALQQLGLGDASQGDLAVFLTYAQRTGLDPWARQIYMIARWDGQAKRNKYTIQASIDGLRIVAQRTGDYAGQVGPEWCGTDGVWRDVWLSNEAPAAARVGVLRRGWAAPQFAVALYREYVGTTRDGSPTRMWADKPALMIAKCAEALALRKAFPQDLSGVYTGDEMSRADTVPGEVVPGAARPPAAAPPAAEALDADLVRSAILGARGRDQLTANMLEVGVAMRTADGGHAWHRADDMKKLRVPDANGVEVTAWDLMIAHAQTLPAEAPTQPAPGSADDVVDAEFADDPTPTEETPDAR